MSDKVAAETTESRKCLWNKWQEKLCKKTHADLISEHETLPRSDKSDEALYGQPIKFGTAGVRDLIGCGFTLLNHASIYTITRGLLQFLRQTQPQRLAERGVVIAYDGRRFSWQFALLVASVFRALVPREAMGKIRLFSRVLPTPALAYATKHYDAAIGVMITASHNSKLYNGYKVYDHRGCFVKEPQDKILLDNIRHYLDEEAKENDVDSVASLFNSLNTDKPNGKIFDQFIDCYEEIADNFTLDCLKILDSTLAKSNVGIAYSAMHGCGEDLMQRVMKCANFTKFSSVKEQAQPDTQFSTVTDPNPEVGYDTLKMCCELGDMKGYQLAFVNDPDADRLAMCEKIGGTWRIFTGNEMAMIYIAHKIEKMLASADRKAMKNACIFYSTVSTMFPRTIARKLDLEDSLEISETLTGFKYLGEKVLEAKSENKKLILAFEESLGFLVGDHVFDKDGISACLAFSELADKIYSTGGTLSGNLDQIHRKYGHHMTLNKYYKVKDMSKIKPLMARLRDWQGKKLQSGNKRTLDDYPQCLGQHNRVTRVRDLTVGYDSDLGHPDLPVSETNEMITFYCGTKYVLTIRASGTEPKLKFYIEKIIDHQQQTSEFNSDKNIDGQESMIAVMKQEALAILEELLEPEKNMLQAGF